ncbi:MAG: SPASM domain-containing protein [Bacteroidales bacterium]|nr:SPASM domain-containing protein [Bacteroidales bacterium]
MDFRIIRDRISILAGTTPRRLWNLFLTVTSFYWSRLTGVVWHAGMPLSLSVEPTTSCNLRCPECPSGLRKFSRNTGMMNLDLYQSIIRQTGKDLWYLLLYFQGEPYMNPHFFDFVRMARERRIYTATSTNAHFLNPENARKTVESGLNRLIISLDGIGQEAYAAYRVGGRYQRVIDGIRNLIQARKELKSHTPHLIVQFIVFRTNEHQLDEAKELCRDLGVDELQFKTAQINDYRNGNDLIPTIDRYSRYRRLPDGSYIFKNSLPNRCYRMWSGSVITWDGLVVPCCFDKDASHRLGNLSEAEFGEIWTGVLYDRFRKQIFASRSSIEICRNCTEGMKL